MPGWIDFKRLRQSVKFADVLAHYKIELKVSGERAMGFCPLPSHARGASRGGGKRQSPSFSAHVERGIWQCFGCKARGNVLDFIAHMEGLNPEDPQQFRKAALIAQERFMKADGSAAPPRKATQAAIPARAPLASDKEVVVNGLLDFELKNLDSGHPYLLSRGFTAETIKHFGLGYCAKGFMKGRVVIPLHDREGRFIGYAGRVVDDAAVSDENPKYRFPGKREHNGVVHEFRKSVFVYNGHAIKAPVDDLIIVEGFASVWWLWQHGHRNAVALMGSALSDAQAEIIVSLVAPGGRIWVFPDGDDAGEKCGKGCVLNLSRHRFVSWLTLEDKRQPTDCTTKELALILPACRAIQ